MDTTNAPSTFECLCRGIKLESGALNYSYEELISGIMRDGVRTCEDLKSEGTLSSDVVDAMETIYSLCDYMREVFESLPVLVADVDTKEEAVGWLEWYLNRNRSYEHPEKTLWEEAFPDGTDDLTIDEIYDVMVEQPVVFRLIYRGRALLEAERAMPSA